MKIKIVKSNGINGQSEINQYIGNEFETVNLNSIYDKETVLEMNKLGEVAVYLENNDRHVSIINKDEYEVIE